MTRFTGSQFCGKIIAYEIRWACFGWNPIRYSMNMYWRSLVQIPSWSTHEDVHKYLHLHLAICCTSSGSKTHLRSYTMKQIGESERERESKFVVKMSVMIARIGLTIYLKNSLIFLSQKHLGWESWLFSFFLHLNFRTGFSHGEFLSFFAWHPLLAPRRPQRHHVGLAHYDATPPTPKPLDSFVEGFIDGSQSKLLPSLNFKAF